MMVRTNLYVCTGDITVIAFIINDIRVSQLSV